MDVCSVCRNIPFESLPSEDEPAIPHYESLEALTESAKKCYLCSLILGMAGQLCQIQQNIKEGKHRDNPGGWISITAGDMLPSGKPVMCSSVEGNISVGGGLMAGPGGYKGPIYFSPCKMFPRGSKVRPWLFGNWWNLDGRSEPQLVGMGVRLGETGIVTQAVGNAEDRIEYGGSNIRIRTDNSKRSSSGACPFSNTLEIRHCPLSSQVELEPYIQNPSSVSCKREAGLTSATRPILASLKIKHSPPGSW